MSTDQLQDIRAFVEVARSGSFIRASEMLHQSTSTISKAISRLEANLDTQLLIRTTRRVALTDEGRSYFQHCERILVELALANDEILTRKNSIQGTVRAHFPQLWARQVVIPALDEFHQRYPKIKLQLAFSETVIDFPGGFDLCVQVGQHPNEMLVSRQLCVPQSLTVAAPAYLERAGTPQHPDELAHHQCIRFIFSDRMESVPWFFERDSIRQETHIDGWVDVGHPDVMVDLALAGLGIIQGPDLTLRKHIESGQLRQVLTDWVIPGPPICAVWPRNRHNVPLRTRVFLDWLFELASGSGQAES